MSLILEALDKVQKQGIKTRKKPVIPETDKIRLYPKEPRAVNIKRRKKRNYPLIVITMILVAAAVNLMALGWWFEKADNTVDGLEKTLMSPQPSKSIPETQPVIQSKQQQSAQNTEPALKVKGIVWDTSEPLVLVNDKFLTEGDNVSGAKIAKVFTDRVKFLYRDKEIIVSIQD